MENKKENQQRWYQKNRAAHIEKVYQRKRAKRLENRAKHEQYLREHPCVDCGEIDIDMLTFDHVQGQKLYDVSKMVSDGYGWDTISAEIGKCVVRCFNHHMKREKIKRRERSARRDRSLAVMRA